MEGRLLLGTTLDVHVEKIWVVFECKFYSLFLVVQYCKMKWGETIFILKVHIDASRNQLSAQIGCFVDVFMKLREQDMKRSVSIVRRSTHAIDTLFLNKHRCNIIFVKLNCNYEGTPEFLSRGIDINVMFESFDHELNEYSMFILNCKD